jgi:TPR repeat protein
MLSTAEQAVPQGRLVRRNAARTAILQAGRRVAERDGISAFSLSAVAAEAGFGPSTVFGHFRNKDELLVAIVAEDLASVASLMRDGVAQTDSNASSDESEWSKFDLTSSFGRQPAAEHGSEEEGQEAVAVPVESAESDAVADLAPSVQGTSQNRPPVDAWLERRLRIFERGLADLEQRMKDAEASSAWAVSISKDAASSVAERLDMFDARQTDALQNLTRRMEETEMRQRGATAEMRAAMNDTATRIEILESARRADQTRVPSSVGEEPEIGPDPNPQDARTHSDQEYVSAAQRAASAAVLLADIEKKDASSTDTSGWRSIASRRVRVRRSQYVIGASLAALAFVLGGFFAFYVGVARGHELANVTSVATTASPAHVSAPLVQHRSLAKEAEMSRAAPTNRLDLLAQQGNPRAQLLVGLKYLHGKGAAPDQPLAAQWIRRAAEQQQPMAEYWLATMFEHGDGVAPDSSEAVRWYEAAAAQGNRKAMHALGVDYAEGRGTSKDYSQAARWFTRAASLGLVNSQFNLGVLYERGLGVPQSLPDAYKWYAVAAQQGDQESAARVDVLRTQLNPDDLTAAQRAALNFHPDEASPRANTNPVLAELTGNSPAH